MTQPTASTHRTLIYLLVAAILAATLATALATIPLQRGGYPCGNLLTGQPPLPPGGTLPDRYTAIQACGRARSTAHVVAVISAFASAALLTAGAAIWVPRRRRHTV